MSDRPRFRPAPALMPQSGRRVDVVPPRIGGGSLTSERARSHMVEGLRRSGIVSEVVLNAMSRIQRHLFVDDALASRAYEDAALPIGHQQTISKPSTVARYAEYALQGKSTLKRVLEVGGGCGYQAAVFSCFSSLVVSIERIEALYKLAQENLQRSGQSSVKILHGDGLKGYPGSAPFDAIVVAAAGLDIPEALIRQLSIGGRLIVPVEERGKQTLVTVDRLAENRWHRENRDSVKFVPLLDGVKNI